MTRPERFVGYQLGAPRSWLRDLWAALSVAAGAVRRVRAPHWWRP